MKDADETWGKSALKVNQLSSIKHLGFLSAAEKYATYMRVLSPANSQSSVNINIQHH
jgi:hypothetical protein